MEYITNKQTIIIDKRNISKFKTIGKDIIIKENDLNEIADSVGCRLDPIYNGNFYLCIQNSITEISGFFKLERGKQDPKAKFTLEAKDYRKHLGNGKGHAAYDVKPLYRLLIVE